MSALLLLLCGQKQMYCRGSWDDCSLFSTASSSQTCKAASVNLSNCSFKKKCHLSAQACKKPCVCLFASQRIWFPSRCSNTSNVESESSGKIRWPLMLNGVSYMLPSSDSCNFLQSALFMLKIKPYGLLQQVLVFHWSKCTPWQSMPCPSQQQGIKEE